MTDYTAGIYPAFGPTISRHINDETWDAVINNDSTTAQVTTVMARFVVESTYTEEYDGTLLGSYQEHFAGWTNAWFDKAENIMVRRLRIFLRQRGIFSPLALPHGSTGRSFLLTFLTLWELPEWPEDELLIGNENTLAPASDFYPRRQALRTPLAPTPPPEATRPRMTTAINDNLINPDEEDDNVYDADNMRDSLRATIKNDRQGQGGAPAFRGRNRPLSSRGRGTPSDARVRIMPTVPGTMNTRQAEREQTAATTGSWNGRPGQDFPLLQDNRAEHDKNLAIPPLDELPSTVEQRKLENFSKVWGTRPKYDGKPYNLLDQKLLVFFNVCQMMGIDRFGYHAVFANMLSGNAEDYYLQHCQRLETFFEVYTTMKLHFEQDVNLAQYHTDWTYTKWSTCMARKSDDETAMDVLNNMLDKLMLCQKAMGPDFRGDAILREKTREAVSGVPAFEYALQDPKESVEGFFSSLRSSLQTVLSREGGRAPASYLLSGDHDDHPPPAPPAPGQSFPVTETYPTDRIYHGNQRGRGKFQNAARGRSSGQSFWKDRQQQRGIRPDSTFQRRKGFVKTSFRNNDHQSPGEWTDKCFVCKELGCWSTNHPIHERQAARTYWCAEFPDCGQVEYVTYLVAYEGDELEAVDSTPESYFFDHISEQTQSQ